MPYLNHISFEGWNHFDVFDTVWCGFLQVREVHLDHATGLFLVNLNWNTSASYTIMKELWRYIQDQDADNIHEDELKQLASLLENNWGYSVSFSF